MMRLREVGAQAAPTVERQVRSVRRRHAIAALCALLLALVAALLLAQKAGEPAGGSAIGSVVRTG